jgi:putative membrane protein
MNRLRRVQLGAVAAVATTLFLDSTPIRVAALAPGWAVVGTQRRGAPSSTRQWQLSSSSVEDQATTTSRDVLRDPQLEQNDSKSITQQHSSGATDMTMTSLAAWTVPLSLYFMMPEAAQAAGINAAPIPNALVAYAHYASLLVCAGLLTYERTTVAAGLTVDQEKNLVKADAAYGLTALFVGGSGIFRVLEYGKGWEFYSHEPMFWLKLSFVGLWASLSLFPTITFVRRGIPLFQNRLDEVEPMSEALARRLQQVITAELSALVTIPVTATLMARGVGYSNDFPWPVGAALATLVTAGSAFVYAKQALNWTEESDKDNNNNKPPQL